MIPESIEQTATVPEIEIDESVPKRSRKTAVIIGGKTVYLNNKELLIEIKVAKLKGTMTDKLAAMLQLLCARYARKGNFVNYCVDEETSALTKRGWMSYTDILPDDELLAYDILTDELKWSAVQGMYISQYDGDMHRLTTEGLDALVTPNHKYVSTKRGIIPVEDIIANEHIVLTGEPVGGGVETYTDCEIQAIGWAITEGHFSTKSKVKHSISISQKLGTNSNLIEECLTGANIPFKRYERPIDDIIVYNCTGEFITTIHNTIAPNRVLTMEFVVSLNQHQRMLLIQTMVNGDGWNRPSGGYGYFQKSDKHTDSFLALCTLAGQTTHTTITTHKTSVSKIKPDGGISVGNTVIIYAEPKKQCKAESIDFHGGNQGPGGRRENKPNKPTQYYSGIVWCPQTEYGTFMCRRNGYIHITGNSYNSDMQSYAMLSLVKTWNSFNPDRGSNPFAFFTQCIKNSFRQYLNHEKKHRDIRDAELINQGLNPSYGYESGQREVDMFDDEQDFQSTYERPMQEEAIDVTPTEDEFKGLLPVDGTNEAVVEPMDGTGQELDESSSQTADI